MILVLTQCFPPDVGGIQNLVGGLTEALSGAARRVVVMADATGGSRAFEAGLANVSVQRFGGPRPLRRRLKAWAAQRLLRSGEVEAVFCDSWKSAELFDPGPVAMSVLAHGSEFPPGASPAKRRRIAHALSKARVVVASSRYSADLARAYVAGATALEVVHPPIGPQPEPTREALGRLQAVTGGARPLLAGLARLEPRKGFDRVIQALPDLSSRWPGLALALGGTGEDGERLRGIAAEAGVADRVHLLGRVDDAMKAALLSSADLFVMPARREGSSVEGFGIVYAEAAWYGVAAVAGREGGAADAVIDGETGRLVDGDDPAAVAAGIAGLLDDEPRRRAMGSQAAERVRRTGTWDAALPRYLAGVLPAKAAE